MGWVLGPRGYITAEKYFNNFLRKLYSHSVSVISVGLRFLFYKVAVASAAQTLSSKLLRNKFNGFLMRFQCLRKSVSVKFVYRKATGWRWFPGFLFGIDGLVTKFYEVFYYDTICDCQMRCKRIVRKARKRKSFYYCRFFCWYCSAINSLALIFRVCYPYDESNDRKFGTKRTRESERFQKHFCTIFLLK